MDGTTLGAAARDVVNPDTDTKRWRWLAALEWPAGMMKTKARGRRNEQMDRLLANAIDSIRIGVEDYETGNP